MPRTSRRATATTTQLSPGSLPGPAAADGVERLRALVKERREAQRPARPTFRDRLEAWLEEEL
jgi:hypothetical protein